MRAIDGVLEKPPSNLLSCTVVSRNDDFNVGGRELRRAHLERLELAIVGILMNL